MEKKPFQDFSKICRTCLSESAHELRRLLDHHEIITACGDIEINEMDDLPTHICLSCLETAQNCFNFREQIKRSENYLKEVREQMYLSQTYLGKEQQTYLLVPCNNDLYLTNNGCNYNSQPTLELSSEDMPLPETTELEAVNAINQALQAELERRNNASEIIEFLNDKSIPDINEALANEYFQIINKQAEVLTTPMEIASIDPIANTFTPFLICHLCSKQFKNKRSFQRHLKRHNEIKQPEVLESLHTIESDEYIRSTLPAKRFYCENCQKSFGEKSKLNTHMKIHKGVKDFMCTICDKRFTFSWQLKVHVKTHLNQKDYSCPFCSRAFGQNINLQNHIRSKHTLDKPFKCPFENCTKAFPTKGELNKHKKAHTGEKPLAKVFCPICSKGCIDNGQLRIHIKTHTKEYNHECNICQKKFLLHTHLVVHIRSKHTFERPFTCTFEGCSKSFYTGQILSKHSKTHIKKINIENKSFLS